MNVCQHHIITEDGITLIGTESVVQVLKDNPLFVRVEKALRDQDYQQAMRYADLSHQIVEHPSGRFKVAGDIVFINGEEVPVSLSNKICQFAKAGLNLDPLLKFWDNLAKNPSEDSKRDLYDFLLFNHVPLTGDGCFIAYKRVNSEFESIHAGKWEWFDGEWKWVPRDHYKNCPGKTVRMPRDKVDPDRDKTCSAGLHVAAYEYAKNFYANGNLIEVKVNPANVVAVPTDYDNQKMRVCEYEVVRECEGPREEYLYEYDSSHIDKDYEDEDEDVYYEDEGYENHEDYEDEDYEDEENNYTISQAFISTDRSGRLCIPKSQVMELGLGPKDTVACFYAENSICLAKNVDEDSDCRLYTVDKSGNIRLSSNFLKSAGLDNESVFKVSVFEDNQERYIVISAPS
jgi:hypothetical protein